MTEQPTILQVARLDAAFRFQITKPDQLLAPIMEIWDVKIRPELIRQLSDELTETIMRHSRRPMTPQAQERIVHLGKALYRQLILPGPTGDRLQAVLEGDSLPLLISTEVPEIPWELLHDGQDFLGLRYAIGRQLLKSAAVPIAMPWQGDRTRCLLIADPCGDLPEARKEAKTLQEWLIGQGIECDLLLGDEANGKEIIVQLSSGSYNFIHYSGHVDVDPATKTHSLVLCDQLLYATEIERAITHNGPVVVLNGCDTASVQGLADAFLKSGAQLVVGTLFDVPDWGARRWAEVFYEALIAHHQAGEALRLARHATLHESECPTAGLAFVMYGNPCLRLIWSKGLSRHEGTPLDLVLRTLELRRQDFDNACLNVLESSLRFAGEAGGVGSAHLFTAMLEGPDSRLRDYLQAKEVDHADMQKSFEKTFRFTELLTTILVDKETDLKLSNSVSHILCNAYDRARQAKRCQATFDDLLVAFSRRQTSGVNTLLRLMGVDLSEMILSLDIESSRPSGKARGSITTREDDMWSAPDESAVQIRSPSPEQLYRTRGVGSTEVMGVPLTGQRFADVSFPASVEQYRWHILKMQILAEQRDEQNVELSVVMPALEPAKVEVCVLAPGFELRGAPQQTIDVPPAGDSEAVNLRLRALALGIHKIRVDFMQNKRYIGTVQLKVEVVERQQEIRVSRAPTIGQPAIGQIGAPPDLTVLISERPLPTGEHKLQFVLFSPITDLGLYYRDVGESTLVRSPAEWVEHVLKQLQQEIAQHSSGEIVEHRLRSIGNTLWDELIPEPFQSIYWRIRDKIHTILLVTDEPWIPWEMIVPYRRTPQDIEEDDYLCLKFSLARWLRGTPTVPRIAISESRVVGAGAGHEALVPLPSVQGETKIVESLLREIGARSVLLEPRRVELIRSFQDGGFHHLHIACHGSTSPKGGDLAVVMLKDGPLSPIDISGSAMTFGRDHPFVFLNACETGRLGASLTRLGGWAERFAVAGCSAFMGTLWAVDDNSAREFARTFYNDICRGVSLGEACRHARSSVRREDDPSWLAYCLYADPQAVLVLPGISPPEPGEGDIVSEILQHSFQRSLERQRAFIDSTQFFEVLLEVGGGAGAQAFQRLGIPAQDIVDVFRQVNQSKPPSPQPPSSGEEVGLSRSVAEILRLAECLARQSGHERSRDVDLLEAFVLQGQNTTTQLLTSLKLEPELLLNGAFQDDGMLDTERFSEAVKAMLVVMVRHAQRTRLVGSPQILAGLVAGEDSLARQELRVRGGDLDTYVRTHLDGTIVYTDRPRPRAVSLEACSTRAKRIFNLAELLARVEGALVGEEHLLRAYVRCAQAAK